MMQHTVATILSTTLFSLALGGLADAQSLATEQVATGFSSPVYVTSPPGDTERLFVVERGGLIKILDNGVLLPIPFLDVDPLTNGGGERGLLGLAFHPDYANNGRFFINYTNLSGNTRVVEYGVSAMDPNIADPTPVQTVFLHLQPFSNHNGGCLQFGPDGKLYIGMGDGGSANDPGNRAQDPQNTLGKMVRLDVDIPSPFIPADNPFVGDASTLDAIWAIGLRNPWRFSFDMLTGDLYIADVGQGAAEEIDFAPASSTGGENYGWRCMEGNNCTGLSGCTCNGPSLTLPIHTYSHAGGNCSITGGHVYRSDEIPALQGTYFFADFCSDDIWSFRVVGGMVTELTDRTAELAPPGATLNSISSFGQDAAGNVYICDIGGQIYKIVQGCETSHYCMATPNSSGNPAAITSAGSASISANDFELLGRDLPAGVFGLFYYGPVQLQTPFGDGFRCVGGSTLRMPPNIQADAQGNVSRQVDLTLPPFSSGSGMVNPGSTWNFQLWFRDPTGPGGSGFNLTDGLSVLFCN